MGVLFLPSNAQNCRMKQKIMERALLVSVPKAGMHQTLAQQRSAKHHPISRYLSHGPAALCLQFYGGGGVLRTIAAMPLSPCQKKAVFQKGQYSATKLSCEQFPEIFFAIFDGFPTLKISRKEGLSRNCN